jgi:hypothetical protein
MGVQEHEARLRVEIAETFDLGNGLFRADARSALFILMDEKIIT